MASVVSGSRKIKTFFTEAAFESWMRKNHAREREVWLRIYKKGSSVPSITMAKALDVVLCWGWIDGIRKAFDERSYLQRYTPRRAKSIGSQINREHVARLTKAGRMTPHGQRQVDAIYVRVSTKEQTENLSLPTQLRACEEYCRRQGYEVIERFHEEGESAKSTDRSQLQNLLTFSRLTRAAFTSWLCST
jgi:uncharacterized protein YdeI (YjbR/CyaY-like superfamily)